MTEFEQTMVEGLAAIKEGLFGVRDHLAKLNGKVAEHERKLVEIEVFQAREIERQESLDASRDQCRAQVKVLVENMQQKMAEEKANAKWIGWLKSAAPYFAGALALAAGQHVPQVIKLFFH